MQRSVRRCWRGARVLKVLLFAVALYVVATMLSSTSHATTPTTPTTPATDAATAPPNATAAAAAHSNKLEAVCAQQASESSLVRTIEQLKRSVQTMRKSKKYLMPLHPDAIELTTRLQNATRCWLIRHLGAAARGALVLAVQIHFPSHMVMKDNWLRAVSNGTGVQVVYVELAPAMLLPCAVYTIMEIAKLFKTGHFHRNAAHVSQAMISSEYKDGMVFMEYDRSYRHEKYSWGFAGRGGTDAIYINKVNNTRVHGPGTDRGGKDPESDVVFGQTLTEHGRRIVDRMKNQPGANMRRSGFVSSNKDFIGITSMRMLSQSKIERTHEVWSALSGHSN